MAVAAADILARNTTLLEAQWLLELCFQPVLPRSWAPMGEMTVLCGINFLMHKLGLNVVFVCDPAHAGWMGRLGRPF